jgi:hypothetical protein
LSSDTIHASKKRSHAAISSSIQSDEQKPRQPKTLRRSSKPAIKATVTRQPKTTRCKPLPTQGRGATSSNPEASKRKSDLEENTAAPPLFTAAAELSQTIPNACCPHCSFEDGFAVELPSSWPKPRCKVGYLHCHVNCPLHNIFLFKQLKPFSTRIPGDGRGVGLRVEVCVLPYSAGTKLI